MKNSDWIKRVPGDEDEESVPEPPTKPDPPKEDE